LSRLKHSASLIEKRRHILVHGWDGKGVYRLLQTSAPVAFRRVYGLSKLFMDDMER